MWVGSEHRTRLPKDGRAACFVKWVFGASVWEPLASFWILILRYPRRQLLEELSFRRWALGTPKGWSTGFPSEGETRPKSGLCPGQMASAQASCATCNEYLAERYSTAPGPSCTLIKQWKSIKDLASLASQFFWVPGEAGSGLATGQEEGGLRALPSPCPKSTANAQQPGFWPDAN